MNAASAALEQERLAQLCLEMTAIASPTGTERPLAEWLAGRLSDRGIDAELQVFSPRRANVVARRRGTGGGASVLLYSPLDTAFPLAPEMAPGPPGLPDLPTLQAGATRIGDWIVGPGAENPKGFATAVLGAFEALCSTDEALRGDVVLALTGGGMPVPRLALRPETDGLGRGCSEFLAHYSRPDFAIIAKPGDAVSVEEVGIALFRVRVRGDLAYTGTRHRAPVRHAILDAARLVERLEAWFAEYSAAHETPTLSPQGAVTVFAAGWPDHPAFLPESSDLWVDLRILPGTTLGEARSILDGAVKVAAADLSSEVTVEAMGGFPGASTPRHSWIVQAAVRAWEARTNTRHAEPTGGSGVTDASILRGHGVPTARIGMPRPDEPTPFSGFSMGAVHAGSIAALARTLVDIVVDTTRRPRSEVLDLAPATEVAR